MVLLTTACSGSLPRPDRVQVKTGDYVAVQRAPREVPVEVVPPQPQKGAVWLDGTWEVSQDRFRWKAGAWVIPPPGAKYARWVLIRRNGDGQLFFAPSYWTNNAGKLPDPPPLLRAKTRTGDTSPEEE
jgi:surface antigen